MTIRILSIGDSGVSFPHWPNHNIIRVERKGAVLPWRLLAWSCIWLVLSLGRAAEVRLAWDPSPDTDVMGYRVHWGTQTRNYPWSLDVGQVTTATVPGLTAGATYYFAATAYTADGRVSDYSNEVAYTVPLKTNSPPSLTAIANRIIAEDSSTGPLAFTVSDPDNDPGGLLVSASSSNPSLVPAGGLVLGGSGANRTLTVTPARAQSGTALITVRVSDGQLTAARAFSLTVYPVNDPPTLSALANRTIAEDSSTGPMAFTVSDPDQEAAVLTVSAVSRNPVLVPAAGLVLGGSGANRTLTVTPARAQSGTALITVRVSDGQLTAARSFELTVTPAAAASWQIALLGQPEAGGASQIVDGQFLLDAAGAGIGGSADQGLFAYQTLAGDGTLTVRLTDLASSAINPLAGVMLRRGLHPSAPMVFWHATPYVLLVQHRSEAGQAAAIQFIGTPQPAPDNWFRLVRSGNSVSTFFSRDGVHWQAAWPPLSGDWAGEVQVGLAAASGYSWKRTRAVLDQVTLSR